ncbi:hypothetical protein ACFL1M_02925 [Patescibacteria group bacterium]
MDCEICGKSSDECPGHTVISVTVTETFASKDRQTIIETKTQIVGVVDWDEDKEKEEDGE